MADDTRAWSNGASSPTVDLRSKGRGEVWRACVASRRRAATSASALGGYLTYGEL